ncbi:cysteine hydrolase family protein [Streptococcus didelphis]|uniref:cysteine hydrolase family protein n=1 Tax=Streptococcus didelphis TaxID=102886 RepID=UPI000375195F
MKALISIDYTYDFVDDKGSLSAGLAVQKISESIAKSTEEAYQKGYYIFFTIDNHDQDDDYHPESKLFPPHNINGTKGRDLYGHLGDIYKQIKADKKKVFWIDKKYYSAFSGTELDLSLRQRGIDTLILTGVLTDICILHTAIDAYRLGYKVEIVTSAIASNSIENHKWALNHCKTVLGASLVDAIY